MCSLIFLFYFFHVDGWKSNSMGNNSSLPASISNISTDFDKSEKNR